MKDIDADFDDVVVVSEVPTIHVHASAKGGVESLCCAVGVVMPILHPFNCTLHAHSQVRPCSQTRRGTTCSTVRSYVAIEAPVPHMRGAALLLSTSGYLPFFAGQVGHKVLVGARGDGTALRTIAI